LLSQFPDETEKINPLSAVPNESSLLLNLGIYGTPFSFSHSL
jgi:hypothetical protein